MEIIRITEKTDENLWSIVTSTAYGFLLIGMVVTLFMLGKDPFTVLKFSAFEVTLIVLATFRVTWLIVKDKIAQYIRDLFLDIKEEKIKGQVQLVRYRPENGFKRSMSQLLGCLWCTSVWIGAIFSFLYILIPEIMIFIYFVLSIAALAAAIHIIMVLIGSKLEYYKSLVQRGEK